MFGKIKTVLNCEPEKTSDGHCGDTVLLSAVGCSRRWRDGLGQADMPCEVQFWMECPQGAICRAGQ